TEEHREMLLLTRGQAVIEEEPFGLRWFWPAIKKHRRVLFEVLVASFFVQLFTLANPLLTQVIIDKVLVQNSAGTLSVLGVLLLGVAFFAALLTGLRTYLFVDTTNRIDVSLGSTIINRLYRLSLGYFQKRPVGELATRLNELENIRQFLTGTALTVVLDGIFSVIYIGVMLAYSVPLTIAALAVVPLLTGLTFFVAPLLQRQLRTRAVRYAQTQSYLVETLAGIQTVKAQNLELHARWKWQEHYSRFVSAGFHTVLTSTSVNAITNFLSRVSDLAVLWYGAYLVLGSKLSLGQLIAFRIISGYVASPLLRMVQSWQQFQEVGLSIERLGDILDAPREQNELGAKNIPVPPIEGAVSFDRVSFAYVKGGPPQLRDVEFEVPAGAFVGVVGQSGSGKSTLLKLLPRLYPVDTGRIFIDRYDIAKVELYSLRRQIGMVLQDSLLFEGTVQENISLGDPDATPESVVEAARIAVAHDFIMGLSEGYNTPVGEGGRALSGGQRQRIAIARVVLQDPRLLILDEATSALDFVTEHQVCANLAKEFKGRSVFFVTHRLRSVQSADLILFLENGIIAERGTHEQLLALRGRYAALYQQQEISS
ncbi:MAG: peptidase domain-containing ABC transporter, partial [Chthoniobacterales bacterium]